MDIHLLVIKFKEAQRLLLTSVEGGFGGLTVVCASPAEIGLMKS